MSIIKNFPQTKSPLVATHSIYTSLSSRYSKKTFLFYNQTITCTMSSQLTIGKHIKFSKWKYVDNVKYMQIFVYWAFFGTKHKNIYAATTIWCLWKKKFLWSNGNFLLYSHFEILLKKVRNVSWVLRETKGLKIGCRQWFVILLIPNSGVGLGDKIHQTLKSQIKKNHSTS